MQYIKTFESWKNNIIDDTLFSSGRAKYHPHVLNGVIHYKTGEVEPYYSATIARKGSMFICKIYKTKRNGDEIRIRNKVQETLKIAHNYVREFLNQKLKKDKEKKGKDKERERSTNFPNNTDLLSQERERSTNFPDNTDFFSQKGAKSEPIIEPIKSETPKSKTIIRRFD
jgi:hypothetical protein